MFANVEDLVKVQQELLKATNNVASTAFEAAKKLAELNMQTARTGFEESAAQMKTLMSTKDPKQLAELISQMSSQFADPESGKAAAYAKKVYEISSATGNELTALIEKQIAVTQKQLLVAVDALAKNAPAGSEGVVNLIKQGVVGVNAAYDQITQGTKQLVEMMESNVANASKTASAAAKKR
jgi:phasin family protein